MYESRKRKNHEQCRFCKWLEDWEEWKKTEQGKARVIYDNRNWIALLDKYPKVKGHTLVISRKPYDDIADTFELSNEEACDFFEIIEKVTRSLRKGLKAEKVYVMSICEHYEQSEILYPDKKTSEHLHFHMIPRYRRMKETTFKPKMIKKRGFIPEKIFMIEGKEASIQELQKLKNRICNLRE